VSFEKKAWKKNLYVCGIDEVGRGSLCGPLVVAAAILPQTAHHTLLKDSKVLVEEERNKAYEWIITHCFFSIVFVDVRTIEKKNIYQATRFAMKKAFLQLLEIIPFNQNKIKYLISDAVPLSIPIYYKHKTLELYNPTHAESISSTVAAASIIAKVTRDNFMKQLDRFFPKFIFAQHKGYGTKIHKEAILQHGISIVHRQSFVQSITMKKGEALRQNNNHEHQQTIC